MTLNFLFFLQASMFLKTILDYSIIKNQLQLIKSCHHYLCEINENNTQ
jgi:hypothetical protein